MLDYGPEKNGYVACEGFFFCAWKHQMKDGGGGGGEGTILDCFFLLFYVLSFICNFFFFLQL